MYAVIRSGGKQYRVEPGKTIQVERLEGKVGGKVTFEESSLSAPTRKRFCPATTPPKPKSPGKS